MDVSGSFLELSCARVVLVPVGASISETRFEELVCHLKSCREVPLNALPRRAALSRAQVPSASATYSSMPEAFREAMQESNAPVLIRSRSAGRDFTRIARRAASSSPNIEIRSDTKDASEELSDDVTERSNTVSTMSSPTMNSANVNQEAIVSNHVMSIDANLREQSNPVANISQQGDRSLKPAINDLDLSSPDVDCSFRMRFEVIRRDSRGILLFKSPSEWDEFHSSQTWGIIGICDNSSSDAAEREARMKSASKDFSNLLDHFKNVPIRRLMVLSSTDTSRASPHVLFQEHDTSTADRFSQVPFSLGFIPSNLSYNETKLEIRAQAMHFSGLLIAAIDRDCWKRRESPQSELFLSPIDERHSADRQSKIAKRRAGRLDKLLADSLLLMGSPREALVKYNSAIERSKASNDRLWLAGAMEGWSAAHVLSHIGSGGHVDDIGLTDMLVEQYNEIYKLYQKKRAAEPEAGAALRLAEYLGTWTSRRKDALSAAQHAASIGENLKTQKRASLWEALARFCERMGCRRKAALFLYRLGHFNASQSSWSSAEELMLACGAQLIRQGSKPWASLSRQILQLAAKYAEEANDSSTAARLWVEALVVSANPQGSTKTDETVMNALQRTDVPSFLPGSSKIIEVDKIDPLNLQGSSFTMKLAQQASRSTEQAPKSGPFIYNPFEAKKKAKAAAVARQSVTWVCGEPAQVSVTLRNRIGAKLSFELIAVLFRLGDKADNFRSFGGAENFCGDEQQPTSSRKHSTTIREALETSSCLVKTISESIQVDPAVAVVKSVTVIPRRPCHISARGLLIRLFGGALVVVASHGTTSMGGSVVNVMPELPILSVTYPCSGLASRDTFCGRKVPMSVLDGETREVKVSIKNAGKDKISWISAKLDVSDPNYVSTHAEGLLDADLLHALEPPGSTHSVILTLRRGLCIAKLAEEQFASIQGTGGKGSCIVTLTMQYEGSSTRGIVRESRAAMKIASKPVISVDRVRRIERRMGSSAGRYLGCLVAVEVSNLVSVPADVNLSNSESEELNLRSDPGADQDMSSHRRCLLESGASVRLVQTGIPREPLGNYEGKSKAGMHGLNSLSAKSSCRLDWALPAFGRKGFLDVCPSKSLDVFSEKARSTYQSMRELSPQILLLPRDLHGREIPVQYMGTRIICSVPVGTFLTIVVRLNLDSSILQKSSELQVSIDSAAATSSHGQHCVCLVGNCRRVLVNLLKRAGEFLEHQCRVRVLSVGMVSLRVSLQAKGNSTNKLADDSNDASELSEANVINVSETGSWTQTVREENLTTAKRGEHPQQTRATLTWPVSSVEEAGDYPGSDLRRLNLNPSIHVIRPTTVDMYQSDSQNASLDLLATSSLTLRAVSSVK